MSDDTGIDRLAEIEARLAAAKPGPWGYASMFEPDGVTHIISLVFTKQNRDVAEAKFLSDAVFIAHAPDDVRWLVDEVKRLQKGRVDE